MAKQAMHRTPTPRIGGAAVIVAFAISLCLQIDKISENLLLVIIAGAIVFVVGLKEDICRDVSPRSRLLAAFASAALAMFLSSHMINRLSLDQIDWIFAFGGVSIVLTLIWSAGVCHSLNLIDGLHGLSSSYTITALAALCLIANQTGDSDIQLVSITLIGALVGFFIFNWPHGRIFMGDAGAYALGHILAWLGITLISRNPDVSPLAILLVLFWPVADTLFSIIRRKILGRAVDQPDRMHFHHIVVRSIRRFRKNSLRHYNLNSTATLVIIPLFSAPAIMGVIFWKNPAEALVALVLCSLAFAASYWVVVYAMSSKRRWDPQTSGFKQDTRNSSDAENSTLSGLFMEGGIAVDVQITKAIDAAGWTLRIEAAGADGRSWAQQFETDYDAWMAFIEALEQEGIENVAGLLDENGVRRVAFGGVS